MSVRVPAQTVAPGVPRFVIAVLSAVVLVVQIAATRLLSATVAYHAAFAVLALVMLAFAGSAAAVYRDRSRANGRDDGLGAAARTAVWAGLILAGTGLVYVVVGSIPWPRDFYEAAHVVAAGLGLYAGFHACGYVVAWLLASWPEDIGRVYFADLLGAALGCVLAVPVLALMGPVHVLIASGLVTTLAGMLLGERGFVKKSAWIAGALTVATIAVSVSPSIVRLRSAKLRNQSSILLERWNQLARVTVSPDIPGAAQAMRVLERTRSTAEAKTLVGTWAAGWAMSERWRGGAPRALWIELDSDAGTQIIEHGGTRPLSELDVLRWDVTAAAYWLRPGTLQRAFVIGGGGGRDFLTALTFGADAVDVVELNPLVVEAVQGTFGEFSGRPYTRPGVSYRLGDARSELSRSTRRYDIIQMSMIDTWAASMTGAMTLSENALYTREAFQTYLTHLDSDGMLTVSRWYAGDHFSETARVLSLMADALRSAGVKDAASHIAVVFNSGHYGTGVATCIMKRSPLTSAERDALMELTARTGFGLLWPQLQGTTIHHPMDVAGVLEGRPAVLREGLYDLSPPGDDRPFFFNTVRLIHVFDAVDARTPLIFAGLAILIVVIGRLLVVGPLIEAERRRAIGDRFSMSAAPAEVTYFAAIGAAFMATELGVLQRYIVFLGHPTYALSVVLFSLLVATALGSLAVGRRPARARAAFPALIAGLIITAFVVPAILRAWHPWPLAWRVGIAAALIVPLGICMGTAFPSGVNALHAAGRERLIPWMWAVNGLAGTLASVLGMFLAMQLGYTALILTSTGGYLVAWAARARFARSGSLNALAPPQLIEAQSR